MNELDDLIDRVDKLIQENFKFIDDLESVKKLFGRFTLEHPNKDQNDEPK